MAWYYFSRGHPAPLDRLILRKLPQRLRHGPVEAGIGRREAGGLRDRRVDVRLQDVGAVPEDARIVHVGVHAERLEVVVQTAPAVADVRHVQHHVVGDLALVGHDQFWKRGKVNPSGGTASNWCRWQRPG